MNYELVIDFREKDLIRYLRTKLEVKIESLDIGDILIRKRIGVPLERVKPRGSVAEDNIVFLIERKTIMDLKSSICDGRWREQKCRIMNNLDRKRIMYIIEGNLDQKLTDKLYNFPVSTLIGSIINTQLRDGIHVYKTSSVRETSEYILKLYKQFCNRKDYCKTNSATKEYSNSIKIKKNSNMNKEVWFICLLCSIPGISSKTATSITVIYPTLRALLSGYDSKKDIEEKRNLLCNLKLQSNNRKIGKKKSEIIFEFLAAEEPLEKP